MDTAGAASAIVGAAGPSGRMSVSLERSSAFGSAENIVTLRPGLTSLADWRAIYRGAAAVLDPVARADVEAGRAALDDILAKSGVLQPEFGGESPSLAELASAQGEPLPAGLVRLFIALKLASLGQGASGTRWEVVACLEAFAGAGLLPIVRAEAGDRLALAALFGAMTGVGDVTTGSGTLPAHKALRGVGVAPLTLNRRERMALIAGSEPTLAAALGGLLEAEGLFQAALVASALSLSLNAFLPLHRAAHRLHRQPGQIEVAAALRKLLSRADGARGADAPVNGAFRDLPFVMGASLDLLRQAGAILEHAANSVLEGPLVLWQSGEIVEAAQNGASLTVATDLIAMALRILGDSAAARIAHSGGRRAASGTSLRARAAAFAEENREREGPRDASGARRLLPMAGTAALLIAIEYLQMAEAWREAKELSAAPALEAVRLKLDEVAETDGASGAAAAANLASVAALVRSGALAAATDVELPSLTGLVRAPRRSG